jgi:hypothetical protein
MLNLDSKQFKVENIISQPTTGFGTLDAKDTNEAVGNVFKNVNTEQIKEITAPKPLNKEATGKPSGLYLSSIKSKPHSLNKMINFGAIGMKGGDNEVEFDNVFDEEAIDDIKKSFNDMTNKALEGGNELMLSEIDSHDILMNYIRDAKNMFNTILDFKPISIVDSIIIYYQKPLLTFSSYFNNNTFVEIIYNGILIDNLVNSNRITIKEFEKENDMSMVVYNFKDGADVKMTFTNYTIDRLGESFGEILGVFRRCNGFVGTIIDTIKQHDSYEEI